MKSIKYMVHSSPHSSVYSHRCQDAVEGCFYCVVLDYLCSTLSDQMSDVSIIIIIII